MPVSVLFADVRGYTSLAETMSSVETTALLHRFYRAASSALLAHDAILGQIAGDEVMAIFVPGLAGSSFPRQAVQAAGALLRGVGYGTPAGSWLEVGVGICTGEEYVGNVGGGGFKDFTAIGDVTNTAARLQASAAGGEIIMRGVRGSPRRRGACDRFRRLRARRIRSSRKPPSPSAASSRSCSPTSSASRRSPRAATPRTPGSC